MSALKGGASARRIIFITIVWIGIAAGLLALAAFILFQGCMPGDCLVERTMLVWIAAATIAFALVGLGIHLFVVAILPRAGRARMDD